MDIKSQDQVCLKIEHNEQEFEFTMPVGASYGSACDAAYLLFEKLLEVYKNTMEKAGKERPAAQECNDGSCEEK